MFYAKKIKHLEDRINVLEHKRDCDIGVHEYAVENNYSSNVPPRVFCKYCRARPPEEKK